jgi:hypothetical protein
MSNSEENSQSVNEKPKRIRRKYDHKLTPEEIKDVKMDNCNLFKNSQ